MREVISVPISQRKVQIKKIEIDKQAYTKREKDREIEIEREREM